MNLGDPTEILDPANVNVDVDVAAALDKVGKQAAAALGDKADIALPAFVLGVVGGAVGGKVLKGTTGMIVGGLAALWAYDQLKSGPKTLAAGQQVQPVQATVAPPLKKNLEGCTL